MGLILLVRMTRALVCARGGSSIQPSAGERTDGNVVAREAGWSPNSSGKSISEDEVHSYVAGTASPRGGHDVFLTTVSAGDSGTPASIGSRNSGELTPAPGSGQCLGSGSDSASPNREHMSTPDSAGTASVPWSGTSDGSGSVSVLSTFDRDTGSALGADGVAELSLACAATRLESVSNHSVVCEALSEAKTAEGACHGNLRVVWQRSTKLAAVWDLRQHALYYTRSYQPEDSIGDASMALDWFALGKTVEAVVRSKLLVVVLLIS